MADIKADVMLHDGSVDEIVNVVQMDRNQTCLVLLTHEDDGSHTELWYPWTGVTAVRITRPPEPERDIPDDAQVCPACDYAAEASTKISGDDDGDETPRNGDWAMCFNCGCICVIDFEAVGSRRFPTRDEFELTTREDPSAMSEMMFMQAMWFAKIFPTKGKQ